MSNAFAQMPNIAIPRSRFNQKFDHPYSMIHGDLVVQDCFMVIPGDEFSYDVSNLIRMSTPVVPIMGNIKYYLHAFFVPMRLIWDDTEKFFGDPSNHDKISSITAVDPATVSIPAYRYADVKTITNDAYLRSVVDYMGKDDISSAMTADGSSAAGLTSWMTSLNLSCLKERAYCAVWNDHFRPSLTVPPILINKASTAASNVSMVGSETFTTGSTRQLGYAFQPFKVIKEYDYFTAATLSPQFGQSVALPLGSYAPLITSDELMRRNPNAVIPMDYTGPIKFGYNTGTPDNPNLTLSNGPLGLKTPSGGSQAGYLHVNTSGTFSSGTQLDAVNLFANLEQATSATINSIRYAFQVQKYLERSNYGSRMFEILNAHYGITNPDSRLQRTERLGSNSFYINVSQVLSTAETTGANLGQPGANSVTGNKCHLFTKAFTEFGYVIVVACAKYERNYSSGFLREDLYKNRFDFYSPEFANLGDQAISFAEILCLNGNTELVNRDLPFGYQEHWAELRYRKNIVSGDLRPGAGLDIWTLADNFNSPNSDPVPGYGFLHEDRFALARCLVTGVSGPDYIVDSHAEIVATRELPLYSIPGLIDHFGAL